MVHVLSNLLHTVHHALRSDGLVLLFQPATAYKIIELTVEGSVLFKEVFEEPNFMDYLVATHTAIHKVIADGIFAKEEEVITPLDGSYNCSDFASVDQWAKEYGWLSDDPEALEQFAAKLRVLANGGTHYVRLYSQDYEVLLRK